ncbi:MAG TPA: quinolinate synthase NadA [Methylomusa anaerophila]|uniref:Quinolinate synthase n=1 Tax=Methylomusa anaerophila TaxID=1930071 RepID=A0A348AQI7_9FIRM|nr:quinolinate synthase NadA [Methylomusa anaerophila]BBB93335.1 quinolinate synthase A [Methylomusa anaerophila]HML86834.1 quinolinate synthase NadA [Methylomusa anaerophila]
MKDLKPEVQRLKKERNAVILAHNYQLDEVQEVADYVGDSFYLSKTAANTNSDVIVFCGVHFMAETAKILSPDKTVLLPEKDAGCPLADMITAGGLRELKARYPGVPVVCYVNSPAEVKAESDVCCTSANAVKVVSSLPDNKVIFVPDEHLGHWVAGQVPDKQLILWQGCCITHAKVKPADVATVRDKYLGAVVLVHPECEPAVVELADFVGSTSAIISYAGKSEAKTFIIGTEMGVLYKLRADNPDKQFFLLHTGLVCPNMKKTRLESVYEALVHFQHEITVEERLATAAKRALTRMLELA